MISPIKAIDVVRKNDGETLDVAEKYEVIDAMWGLTHFKLTDEHIRLLKEGKCLYYNDYEYATLISYDYKEGSNE